MDKAIYLLDKMNYRYDIIKNLTHKDLEEWVAENDYEGDNSILKIDANGYNSVDEALSEEMPWVGNVENYYWVFSFGF